MNQNRKRREEGRVYQKIGRNSDQQNTKMQQKGKKQWRRSNRHISNWWECGER